MFGVVINDKVIVFKNTQDRLEVFMGFIVAQYMLRDKQKAYFTWNTIEEKEFALRQLNFILGVSLCLDP